MATTVLEQQHHTSNNINAAVEFVDYLPSMVLRLGEEAFLAELCSGFRLLMDVERGLITFESLKRNSLMLGIQGMQDDEIAGMLMEGDLDGDGALSQLEFCILMFRLSPGLMNVDADEPKQLQPWTDDQTRVGFQ